MRFKAEFRLVATEDGGRLTPAAWTWRPVFRISKGGEGTSMFLERPEGAEVMVPGASYQAWATLLTPELFAGQLQPGTQFGLYEGHRVVGNGTILQVVEDD